MLKRYTQFSNCFLGLAVLVLFAAGTAHAAGLPDTGQTTCYNGSAMVACDESNTGDGATYPGQDARFGRDAAATAGQLTKIGGGAAGFDYTKVCNSGELAGQGSCPADPALGDDTNEWACTKDNITGMIWEVKVNNDAHLRHKSWGYSWYSDGTRTDGTAGAMNASNAGSENRGNCLNKYHVSTNPTGNRCDTAGYVEAINSSGLCGATNWRLPSRRELHTLVYLGGTSPTIDSSYFPNTQTSLFWSASSYVSNPTDAWIVDFPYGFDYANDKTSDGYVRLVRGGQF